MDVVHAIAKVRFGSAKAQKIQLHDGQTVCAELLCMESGQKLKSDAEAVYYVITGAANVTVGDKTTELSAGQLAAAGPHEPHTIAACGDRRLVCLAVRGAAG